MSAIILHHSRHEVNLRDPRDVFGSDHPIEGTYALPQPGIDSPIVAALTGDVPADTCTACQEPVALHYDTSGCLWIGCLGVPSRKAVARLTAQSLRETAVWGDAHPKVSAAIRDLLTVGCGEAVGYFFDTLSHDAQTNLSRRLAAGAVVALRLEDAGQ